MPTNDLLNASQYLDEPVVQEGQAPDAGLGVLQGLSSPVVEESEVQKALPDTLNIGGVDTGIKLNDKQAAFLVGMGDGIMDTIDGVNQLIGRNELQMEQDQAQMNELYNDPRFGTAARVGQVGGMLVDPVGVLVPVAKAKSLGQVALTGAAVGTAFGGLGYVDEVEGQTREGNALIGMVTGGVMSPTLFAGARAAKGVGAKIQEKSSDLLLNTYKKQFNKYIMEGATPTQATNYAMKRMGWSTQDKARLILSSGKPFEIKQDFTREAAEKNLLAMQSKPIRAVNDFVKSRPWAKSIAEPAGKVAHSLGDAIKRGIVPISTRIAKIDSDVGKNLIKMEAQIHKSQYNLQNHNRKFLQMLKKAESHPDLGKDLQRKLFAGDMYGAMKVWSAIHGGSREALAPFARARKSLDALYDGQRSAGYNIPKLENYFPRRVRDFDGLSRLEDSALAREMQIFKEVKRRHPNDKELDTLIRNMRNPKRFDTAKTGSSLRKRQIEEITDQHLEHYEPAHKALYSYMNDAVTDIERAKFFKAQGVGNKSGFELDGTDLDGEDGLIGRLLSKGERRGQYLSGEVQDLTDMLKSRFTQGEMAPIEAVGAFKNATYIATLGNFKSALTQFGDIAWSAHKNGIINTAISFLQSAPGLVRGKEYLPKNSKVITKQQIGLDEAAQDFAGDMGLKKALDWILRKSGFANMDRLGKDTFVNAHLRKVSKALNGKNAKQERMRLRRKWMSVFGDETDAMIDDIANKRLSDNVATYLFDSLSEVQPIALSEMPQAYLNNPNGRIFYMLRSFTIKQLDLMRRDILDKVAAGDYYNAGRNMMSLGALFVGANGSADLLKDFMSGKEIEMEDTLVDNVWKLAGLNRYTGDRFMSGTPGKAVIDMIAPPLTVYDRLLAASSPDKVWAASPFNGLQVFDELLQTGWTKPESEKGLDTLGSFHDSWDE